MQTSNLNQYKFDPFVQVDASLLRQEEETWIGTGRIMMLNSLRSPRENIHIHFAGQFLNSHSFLTLHLYFDDFLYDTGLQIRFSPILENENTNERTEAILVELAEPGYSYRTLGHIEKSLAYDKSFYLRLETISRLNNSQRLLIWNDQILIDSLQRRRRDTILEGNADIDSSSIPFTFYRWGQGQRWGATLNNTRISQLKRDTPYVDN